MSPDEHEALGMQALTIAEQYRNWRGFGHVETVGAYSALALAQFAAADVERRKEAARG